VGVISSGEEFDFVIQSGNESNETPPAKPGDSSANVLWTIVLLISAFGFAATTMWRRKKEQ
jgi:hypothetical protein